MATVTIVNIDGSILKKSPAFIENKTVSQILEAIKNSFPHQNSDQYVLGIKTPAYIKILKTNSIPLNKYSGLIDNDLTNIDSIPNFALMIFDKTQQGKIFLTFKVSSPDNKDIIFPPFDYGFVPDVYSCKHVSSFIIDLKNHFGLQISNPKIFLNNQEVSTGDYVKKFIKDISNTMQNQKPGERSCPIEFRFNIEQQGLKIIKTREKVLQEIIDTEMQYYYYLTILNNYFGQKFKDQKILNENDQKSFFGPVPSMINTSVSLTNELAKRKTYSSCVAKIFSKFLFDFQKTSGEYFVNYNKKIKFMTDKLDSLPEVKLICQKAPDHGNFTFQSMAIRPIQRFPRYVLLLKELSKFTPKSHPDYLPLEKVNDQLKRMVHGMEEAHLVRGVKDIQERLEPLKEYEHQSIVTKDRILVEEFNVLLKEKKKQRGTLYLFNDLILLSANCEREREREIEQEQMRSEYNKFIFIPNYQDSTSIGIYFKEEMRIIEFSSAEQIAKFSTAMSELRSKMIENSSQNSLPTIKAVEYFPPPSQVIPMMTDTSCGKVSNSVSIVSYKSYMIFDTRHESLTIASDIKNVHNYSKVVLIKDVPYIYGGCKKAGPFELLNNKFEESRGKFGRSENSQPDVIANTRSLPTEGLKESRIHHTCCAYEEFIVIYGGVNPKNRGKLYSDIHFYSVDTGEWFISDPTILTPEPRYKHSAVVYKNLMIIHGGISAVNHAVLNDTWCYNFLNGKWTIINLKNLRIVVPRFGHAAAIVNRFMFILGGSTIHSNSLTIENNQKVPDNFDEKVPDNFPNDDENNNPISLEESSLTNDSIVSISFILSDCVAAPSCFCLNIETGHLSAIEIEGNFLPGLSMFSAVYDEISKKIIIFGGTDPQNKYSKGLPIVSSLDIPQHYTSDNSKPPKEPVDVEKISSVSTLLSRKKSSASIMMLEESRKDRENNSNDERGNANDSPQRKVVRRRRKVKVLKIQPVSDQPVSKHSLTPEIKHVAFIDGDKESSTSDNNKRVKHGQDSNGQPQKQQQNEPQKPHHKEPQRQLHSEQQKQLHNEQQKQQHNEQQKQLHNEQ
ncbi:hypothetical protein M9Y10_041389 [Tritrichomonas musculus]|uniref:DH domain-containing protein n=1 Tax=Tritrichomonas musculus TaxID=1915356 RepID=A0ABR2K4T6_9EUKA